MNQKQSCVIFFFLSVCGKPLIYTPLIYHKYIKKDVYGNNEVDKVAQCILLRSAVLIRKVSIINEAFPLLTFRQIFCALMTISVFKSVFSSPLCRHAPGLLEHHSLDVCNRVDPLLCFSKWSRCTPSLFFRKRG